MIYLVKETDGYETYGELIFDNKTMAEKYCEIHNEIDGPEFSWYILEKEVNTFDLDCKVAEYYSYYIGKNEDCNWDNLFTSYRSELCWYLRYQLNLISDFDGDFNLEQLVNNLSNDQKDEMFRYLNDLENRFDNDEYAEKMIYNGDIIIENKPDYIQVYSVESPQKAKEEALKLYNQWRANNSK